MLHGGSHAHSSDHRPAWRVVDVCRAWATRRVGAKEIDQFFVLIFVIFVIVLVIVAACSGSGGASGGGARHTGRADDSVPPRAGRSPDAAQPVAAIDGSGRAGA
jgi:hypothetical protein